MKLQKQAFTLVELIVVVTILAVLATIGFVSYSGYLAGTRDTNRVSNIKALSDGLELYRTKHSLPLPEDYIEVISKGEVIGYQGYVGQNVLETIEFSNGGKDPKYENYYSYYLTSDKRYFQLMGYLEEEENLQSDISTKVNAEIADYSVLYPIVYGQKLGILTDEENTPIQEVSSVKSAGYIDLGGTNSGTIYKAHINDGRIYSFTGYILEDKLYTLSNPDKYGAPKDCPEGFIGVWGDSAFDQLGFCVAKYEMTYAEEDSPGTPNSDQLLTTYNTYTFDDDGDGLLEVGETGYGKKVVSRAGDYPIADLTQFEAINACKVLGNGYHLITNNEWMSISRQIEFEKENWSSLDAGNGFIYNGVSNNTTLGCDAKGGNVETRTYATTTGPGNNSCDDRRKLKLFNSQYIWDLSGNVMEHVNKANTLDGSGFDSGQTSIGTSTSEVEWTNGDIDFSEKLSYGPLIGVDSSQGVGKVNNLAGASNNIFLRGEDASSTNESGIYYLGLGATGTEDGGYIGFRCAYID